MNVDLYTQIYTPKDLKEAFEGLNKLSSFYDEKLATIQEILLLDCHTNLDDEEQLNLLRAISMLRAEIVGLTILNVDYYLELEETNKVLEQKIEGLNALIKAKEERIGDYKEHIEYYKQKINKLTNNKLDGGGGE